VATTTGSERQERRDRALKPGEVRLLLVLGLPTFAYALATTVGSTYLPVRATEFVDSTTVVGLLIAMEGVMALLIAVPAGALSDHARGRLPLVAVGSPIVVGALVLMGFVHSLGAAIVVVAIFFAAYFVAYEPYRALYPDLTDPAITGRAQSTQALYRGVGTIIAIAAGGLLFDLDDWVPFAVGAIVCGVAVAIFMARVPRDRPERCREGDGTERLRDDLVGLRELVRARGDIRAFLVVNALWEFALGALKTWIILYLTKGLEVSTTTAALAVTGGAVFVAIATPVSGKLADQFGSIPVMRWSLVIYGLGLLVPFLFTSHALVAAATPLIAIGGGVVMTLPYALLIPLMGQDNHGLTTGLYSVSRGVGTSLGPLLAGVAIGIFSGPFDGTQGYQAVWGVCAAAILLSVPLLGRLEARSSPTRGPASD